ncbi:serine hydrolase family protein [Allosaccharopolyspora coralli]|uniref:Serine hydrolase family protein n=1 Tax=Allosaccharopolyspora coralli TaxID=2665642 RepID=A0A5Q3Q4D6_9PSEU|nr:alpha/beta hydrolase [Allosaccharopolyspora coralli]QGK69193.1 serine hydrolase family protein [Allosaccharopolyspora coralli]
MSRTQVLLIPDRSDVGPWHWMRWLVRELDHHEGAAAEVVGVGRAPRPEWDEGVAALRAALSSVADDAHVVVAAQGNAAALWLQHAATVDTDARRADQVLLVAPPEPSRRGPAARGVIPYPVDAHALRRAAGVTRLVAGSGDPTLPLSSAHALADALQVELDVIPDGERLDTAAGYGRWPSALRWALYGTVPLLDRFDGEVHTVGYLPGKLRPA